jgi:hypothetical protein
MGLRTETGGSKVWLGRLGIFVLGRVRRKREALHRHSQQYAMPETTPATLIVSTALRRGWIIENAEADPAYQMSNEIGSSLGAGRRDLRRGSLVSK